MIREHLEMIGDVLMTPRRTTPGLPLDGVMTWAKWLNKEVIALFGARTEHQFRHNGLIEAEHVKFSATS